MVCGCATGLCLPVLLASSHSGLCLPLTSIHLGNLASPPSSRSLSTHTGEVRPPREVKHSQGSAAQYCWHSPPRGGGHAKGMPPESVTRAGQLFLVTGTGRSSVPLTHRKQELHSLQSTGRSGKWPPLELACRGRLASPAKQKPNKPLVEYS